MFKDCATFIDFISAKKTSAKVRQDDYKLLITKLGNPQKRLKCIHVAGTNGKGSVTNYLRSILQRANYKVGTFTSPHLIVHNDRIRINDVYISDEELLDIANRYYDLWFEYDLSMFDIDMIISVIYFIEKEVDYVIYEVGLGGRLDSTNIIEPIASIITNIGFDHMELLGDTLAKIAYEKAGIIKDKGLIFTAEDKEECLDVFKKQAKLKKAEFHQVDKVTNYHVVDHIYFDILDYHDVQLDTMALYQIKNAALALTVCEYLRANKIINITRNDIVVGLKTAYWPGRFEIMMKSPMVIIDGAHNEHGIKAIQESLSYLPKPLRIVFSALKDKQYELMIKDLIDFADEFIVTEFSNQRALSAKDMAEGIDVTIITDHDLAIDYAINKDKNGSVLITGSLYFISEVRKRFKGGR
ncbi:MAG: folylpolyglutamate synthase/dihydrofolate synthase family protein [Erysipelotrichaceae bacterium]|nr:folylpolyglutamate synthase/dihydrofolate synthase family protein [Erysipelotrichaceae bacterium]